jgi:hypothetical protein
MSLFDRFSVLCLLLCLLAAAVICLGGCSEKQRPAMNSTAYLDSVNEKILLSCDRSPLKSLIRAAEGWIYQPKITVSV